MDPARLFQIITNSTLLATRLLSGNTGGLLQFAESRYCALLPEDAPLGTRVTTVGASHKTGARVRYSITGGNRDGLFTIDQHSGVITLGAHLDHEIQHQHNLIVAAEAGGVTAHSLVHVAAGDVNDNAPVFSDPMPRLTVIEEDDRDLPLPIVQVSAVDKDRVDRDGLLYTLTGDGVDGLLLHDAFFSIDPQTGVITQLRALDRDPPKGKPTWKLKVRVSDGQKSWSQNRETPYYGGGKEEVTSSFGAGDMMENEHLEHLNVDNRQRHQNNDFQYIDDTSTFKLSDVRDLPDVPIINEGRMQNAASLKSKTIIAKKHRRENRSKRPTKVASVKIRSNSNEDEYSRNDQKMAAILATENISHSYGKNNYPKAIYKTRYDDYFNDKHLNDISDLKESKFYNESAECIECTESDELSIVFSERRAKFGANSLVTNRNNFQTNYDKARINNSKTMPLKDKSYYINGASVKSKSTEVNEHESFVSIDNSNFILNEENAQSGNEEINKNTNKLTNNSDMMHDLKYERFPYKRLTNTSSDKTVLITKNDKKIISFLNSSIHNHSDSTNQASRKANKINERKLNFISQKNSAVIREPRSVDNSYDVVKYYYSHKSVKFRKKYYIQRKRNPSKYLIFRNYPKINAISETSFLTIMNTSNVKKYSNKDRNMKNMTQILFSAGLKGNSNVYNKTQIRREHVKIFSANISALHINATNIHNTKIGSEKLYGLNEGSNNLLVNVFQEQIPAKLDEIKLRVPRSTGKYQDKVDNIDYKNSTFLSYNSMKYSKYRNELQKSGKVRLNTEVKYLKNGTIRRIPMRHAKNSKSFPIMQKIVSNKRKHMNRENNKHFNGDLHNLSNNMHSILIEKKSASENIYNNQYTDFFNSTVNKKYTNVQLHDESNAYYNNKNIHKNTFLRDSTERMNTHYSVGLKRSILVNQLGIKLDSGGCLDPTPESLYSTDDSSDKTYSLFDEYQRLLRLVEIEKGVRRSIHVVETEVTITVKDINDNSPIFPNATMFGEVQENGPIDLSVAVVQAWDADDAGEGNNARLTYSIEKNVLQDNTGAPLFQIGPRTGVLTTALCCLDRETTPEYHIQVVASDGGGLKGTGTVIVRLSDVNDNAPRLLQREWKLQVPETVGDGPPSDESLLELAVTDPDRSNYFFYRVVEDSGWGWDHFDVKAVSDITSSHSRDSKVLTDISVDSRQENKESNKVASELLKRVNSSTLVTKSKSTKSSASVGFLYAIKTLDYENEAHRRGFRFLVEVTDRGRGGWDDPRHTDQAWVIVSLMDVNDNAPQFQRRYAHVTVREDVQPGTVLASLPAVDPDEGSKQRVSYHVAGQYSDDLTVDYSGNVQVIRSLDRESLDRGIAVVKVVAMDTGLPPLSTTATLSLSLSDVNDCPPELNQPRKLHVIEGAAPGVVGVLTATDKDVWALGNGPPFKFVLSPSNPPHILQLIQLKMDPLLDSGRGGATVWTNEPLDREEWSELVIDVEVTDAGGLSAINPILLVVDDTNDHPMKPGSKTVYLWSTKGGLAKASLGRVYVEDPDDWDVGDKSFAWRGVPHPLFTLNTHTGQLYTSGYVREGRYDLELMVSDSVWHQEGVTANVTVIVQLLDQEALANAVPLTLTPLTARVMTQDWHPLTGGGLLGKLTDAIINCIHEPSATVEIVSVSGTVGEETSILQRAHPSKNLFLPTVSQDNPVFITEPKISRRNNFASFVANPKTSNLKTREDSRLRDIATSANKTMFAENLNIVLPSTCVWLAVRLPDGTFMNAVKLHGLLEMQLNEIEQAVNLTVFVSDELSQSHLSPFHHSAVSFSDSATPVSDSTSYDINDDSGALPSSNYVTSSSSSEVHNPSSAASRVPKTVTLQVVDNNRTALVTPRLSRPPHCDTSSQQPHVPSRPSLSSACRPEMCRNGGKCAPDDHRKKCICPGHTVGENCHVVSRSFSSSSWAWVEPLPACLPISLSFRVLTKNGNGILLYSGPLTSRVDQSIDANYVRKTQMSNTFIRSQSYVSSDGFERKRRRITTADDNQKLRSKPSIAVQLNSGKLELVMGAYLQGSTVHTLNTTTSLSDGLWHTVHVSLGYEGALITADSCSRGWRGGGSPGQCRLFAAYSDQFSRAWQSSGLLQVGGIAQSSGIMEGIVSQGLHGCMSHLKVNNKFVDLGKVPYSHNTSPGCLHELSTCADTSCGSYGRCHIDRDPRVGKCICYPGFTGNLCEQRTKPVTLHKRSYAKVALSFTPDPFLLSIQLRLRTRQMQGVLLRLAAHHNTAAAILEIRGGILCATLQSYRPQTTSTSHLTLELLQINNSTVQSIQPVVPVSVSLGEAAYKVETCLSFSRVSDGQWHKVLLKRLGHDLLLQLDDGENWNSNQTSGLKQIIWKERSNDLSAQNIEVKNRDTVPDIVPPPMPLYVDKRDGVTIGGIPVFNGLSLVTVKRDLMESCLDDIRIDGYPIPLPPKQNATLWGQVTTFVGFRSSCIAPDVCTNVTCAGPMSCVNLWRQHVCSCPVGQRLLSHSCQLEDICQRSPCLHAGSCYFLPDQSELDSSYLRGRELWEDDGAAAGAVCRCRAPYTGRYCEWGNTQMGDASMSSMGIIGGVLGIFTFAVLLVVLLLTLLYRRRSFGSEYSVDTEETCQESKQRNASSTVSLNLSVIKKKTTGKNDKSKSSNNLVHKNAKDLSDNERKISLTEPTDRISTIIVGGADDTVSRQQVLRTVGVMATANHDSMKAKDDLRAYAYEGEGSSGSSWGSTMSGLRKEITDDIEEEGRIETSFITSIMPITPGFSHVIDLLKNLPDVALGRKHSRCVPSCNVQPVEQIIITHSKDTICNPCYAVSNETFPSPDTSVSKCVSVSAVTVNSVNLPKFPSDSKSGSCRNIRTAQDTQILKCLTDKSCDKVPSFDSSQYNFQRSCSNLFEFSTRNSIILDDGCSDMRKRQYRTLPHPSSATFPGINERVQPNYSQPMEESTSSNFFKLTNTIDPPTQFLGNDSFIDLSKIKIISHNVLDNISYMHENSSAQQPPNKLNLTALKHQQKPSLAGGECVTENSTQDYNSKSREKHHIKLPSKRSLKVKNNEIETQEKSKSFVQKQELSTAC